MASSVSGADDYAQNLYYSHTQYNDSNVAILSNKTELLSTQMMQNQSNYNVAIDKLKISSLDGIILSYFPQNKLKLGLQLTNIAGTVVYQELTLLKDGTTQFIPQLEHSYCIFTNNSNLVNVFNTSTPPLNITITLPRLPIKCFYNSVNNYLYYHDNYILYSYDITNSIEYKEDDITFLTLGIRCIDYNEITNKIVATSGAGFYEFYSISSAGRIVDGENITFLNTLNNITAIQCGIQNVYVLNNIDINYFSGTQTLYIFDLTGYMTLQLNISQYNVIREMECRLEDNILNFYSEGTIANYASNTQGGGYIPPLIGMTVNNVVNRLLPGLTNTSSPNVSNNNLMGNFVYSVIAQTIYASIQENNNYGIQTYNSIIPSEVGSFTIQAQHPVLSVMPTNTYNGNSYYAKYISYMNNNNDEYLFTSVFKNTSTIEIYVLDINHPQSTTLSSFSIATSGYNPVSTTTLLQPMTGSMNTGSGSMDITGVSSGFLYTDLTTNFIYGNGFYYGTDGGNGGVPSLLYTYTMGQLSPNPTSTLNIAEQIQFAEIQIRAIATFTDNIVFVVISGIQNFDSSNQAMLYNANTNTYVVIPLTEQQNAQGYKLTGMSVNDVEINFTILFTGGDNSTSSFVYNRTDLSLLSNYNMNIGMTVYTFYHSIANTVFTNSEADNPNTQFNILDYTTYNTQGSFNLLSGYNLLGFLGNDQFNNLLVSVQNLTNNLFGVMAFNKTTEQVVYYFTNSNTQVIAISQFTNKQGPPGPPEWQLYQVIIPSSNDVDSNTFNNNYPLNDSTQYMTIDEHNNFTLTYCKQATNVSNEGIYYSVKLTPPTFTNNLITLNTAPYIPTNLILRYNGSTLGNFDIAGLENYNLMYDRNMCCYYARNKEDLLKGFLDNINNIINFIQYFNFSLLDPNSNPSISTYAKFMYCIENQPVYQYQLNSYQPSIMTLQYLQNPTLLSSILTVPQQFYVDSVLGFNIVENYYIFSTSQNNVLNYYTYNNSSMNLVSSKTLTNTFSKITNTFGFTVAPILSKSQSAIYSLQEYVNSINNGFQALYTLINTGGFVSVSPSAPYVSMNWQTGFITLNYDKTLANVNNGIFVNNLLLDYMKFQVSPSSSPFLSNKYVLNSIGVNNQSKLSFFKFNTVDKLVVNSTMSIIGDQTGNNTQSITFSDLDFNLSDIAFLNMSGSFIYAPTLLRLYTLVSNEGLRRINYSVMVRYLDKSELPFLIQENQNVSIKFIFQRIY